MPCWEPPCFLFRACLVNLSAAGKDEGFGERTYIGHGMCSCCDDVSRGGFGCGIEMTSGVRPGRLQQHSVCIRQLLRGFIDKR